MDLLPPEAVISWAKSGCQVAPSPGRSFAEPHPEIDLRVSATTQYVDLVRDQVDLAIRLGDGHWPGLDAVRLCSELLFPVCSPKLLLGSGRGGPLVEVSASAFR
jgi:DNA-binding transcriptional LysR family regulator